MNRPRSDIKPDHAPNSVSSPKQDVPPKPALELEPLNVASTPRHVEQTNHGLGTIDPEVPVPAHPLHLCPNCDYNLTGLRSRRCPECGESFSLGDARGRGFETSDEMKSLLISDRWAEVNKYLGITLIVASFITINWVRYNPLTGLGLYKGGVFSFRGVLCFGFILSMLALGAIMRAFFEFRWASILLAIGLVLACLAVTSFI